MRGAAFLGARIGTLIIVLMPGLSSCDSLRGAHREACEDACRRARIAVDSNDYERARERLEEADLECGDDRSRVDALRRQIDAAEAAYLAKKEEAAAADKALDEAEMAREFVEAAKKISAQLKQAETLAQQGKWEAAERELRNARKGLNHFRRSSVKNSKEWLALSDQQTKQLAKIQPQLDKIFDADIAKQNADWKVRARRCNTWSEADNDGTASTTNVNDCTVGCSGGDGDSCLTLAILYDYGNGVPKDHQESVRLTKRSCELGSKQGCARWKDLSDP